MASNEDVQNASEPSVEGQEIAALGETFDFIEDLVAKIERRGVNNLPAASKLRMDDLRVKLNNLFLTDVVVTPPRQAAVAGPSGCSAPVKKERKINGNVKYGKCKGSRNDPIKVDTTDTNEYSSHEDNDSDLPESSSEDSEIPSDQRAFKCLAKAITKLDSRKVPALKKFNDSDGGQDFNRYLIKFEQYCRENLKPNRRFWVQELEDHLEGDILIAYQTLVDEDDSYDEVRKKLKRWNKDTSEVRRKRNRDKFKSAAMEQGELLHTYSIRLERLYKISYPNQSVDNSKKLVEKFTDSVLSKYKSVFRDLKFKYKMKDKSVSWATVQKCARLKDAEKRSTTDDQQPPVRKVTEININTGQPNNGMNSQNNNQNVRNEQGYRNEYSRGRGGYHRGERGSFRGFHRGNYQNEFRGGPRGGFSDNGRGGYQRGSFESRGGAPTGYRGGYRGNNWRNNSAAADGRNFTNFTDGFPTYLRQATSQCSYCGRFGHDFEQCRVRWCICYDCGNMGHSFRNCDAYAGSKQGARQRSSSAQPRPETKLSNARLSRSNEDVTKTLN